MTQLSPAFREAISGQETDEVILPLLELSQSDWEEPVRIVANTEPITHMGNEYLPLGFEISLPDQQDEGIPVLNWRVDNTDQRLIDALRGVKGFVDVRAVWVLASSSDHIEVGPFEVELRAARYNAEEISGTMGIDPIFEMPFGHMTMTPQTAPALF